MPGILLLATGLAAGYQGPDEPATSPQTTGQKQEAPAEEMPVRIVVPAGTKVPLVLKHAVSTKSARPGDGVYLETTFPVTQNDRVVIPAGTYVQGEITSVKRSGRVKGRAELLLHFTTLIYPNGYTVKLPGALDSVPGSEDKTIKDDEGTIQAEGSKGRDVKTAAGTAATGAVIGGVAAGGKGAGIGAGVGGAAGVLIGLFSRGNEVRLESGTAVEMVLQRDLVLEERRLDKPARELVPVKQSDRRLEKPVLTPPPDTH
ncbi:MAG TPA: hypothetical protein VNK82_07120 [Terriglobales bacterium]|nr:hypothetical protein [Terriglobales bacterium]